MGSYSVFCALSGLPIDYAQKVVAWTVIPNPIKDGSGTYPWLPTMLPVTGEYDTYGGVDDHDFQLPLVLCHADLFEEASARWHKDNCQRSVFDLLTKARSRYQENLASYQRLHGSISDPFWSAVLSDPERIAQMALTSAQSSGGYNFLHVVGNFTLAVPGEIDDSTLSVEDRQKVPCAKTIGAFETMLIGMVMNGFEREQADLLQKLVCVYNSGRVRGRHLIPSQYLPYAPQFPDYEEELDWQWKVVQKAEDLRSARLALV